MNPRFGLSVASTAALLLSAGQATAQQTEFRHYAVIAPHGMATTLHPLATQTALDVLKSGGNAIDAVIAANAATGVLLPSGNGIGGDLFAIVWSARDGKLYGLNASGRSPRGLSLEQLRREVGESPTIPRVGPLSISVPGAVDGWFELHRRFGSRPMTELLAPAIRFARRGAPGRGWSPSEALQAQPGFAAHFLPEGKGPRPGEKFRRPELAKTLEMIVAGGRDAYYRGEIARTIDRFCRRVGCHLRYEDLAAHESEWVEPIGVEFAGYTLWELPHNTQGLAALQMLRLLEPYDLKSMGLNSPEYLHHLIEAKKIAFEDRGRFYADPQFADIPIRELLTDAYTKRRRRLFDPAKAGLTFPIEDPRINQTETTYMAIGDSSGNMVSLIQSNYAGFGSGFVPDGLGFGFQNRGALFALEDGHPNVFEPGKRPFHTIIPGFITKDGKPHMAFGSTGGDMQPQVHVQVFLNHVLFGMDVQEAGNVPRWRHYGSTAPTGGAAMADGGCVVVESGIPEDTRGSLRNFGHTFCEGSPLVGGRYMAVMWDGENGVYWGASEPRDAGQASGW